MLIRFVNTGTNTIFLSNGKETIRLAAGESVEVERAKWCAVAEACPATLGVFEPPALHRLTRRKRRVR